VKTDKRRKRSKYGLMDNNNSTDDPGRINYYKKLFGEVQNCHQ
jgi:hypothetical protein